MLHTHQSIESLQTRKLVLVSTYLIDQQSLVHLNRVLGANYMKEYAELATTATNKR